MKKGSIRDSDESEEPKLASIDVEIMLVCVAVMKLWPWLPSLAVTRKGRSHDDSFPSPPNYELQERIIAASDWPLIPNSRINNSTLATVQNNPGRETVTLIYCLPLHGLLDPLSTA